VAVRWAHREQRMPGAELSATQDPLLHLERAGDPAAQPRASDLGRGRDRAGDRRVARARDPAFGSEPHWDETREYFRNAWTYVLAQMAATFDTGTSRM
jgi:hypothetical protein